MEKKMGQGQKGLAPIGKPGQSPIVPPTVAKPQAAAPEVDPVDAWVNENPAGKEFTAPEPAKAALPIAPDPATEAPADVTETPLAAAPDAAPQSETPSQSDSIQPAATAKTDAPATDDAAPTTTPEAAAPPSPVAQDKPVATPAAPAEPTRIAADGKYAFAEGAEPWTGEQVVAALRERSEFAPKAAEAEGFRQFFGGDLENAKQRWAPVLESLQSHPDRVPLIQDLLNTADQAKVNYLLESARFYDSETGGTPATAPAAAAPAAPVQPQYAQLDPAVQKQLETFQRAESERQARDQWNYALTSYPVLQQRPELRNGLLELFNAMYARDPSTTLYDALKINAPLYKSIEIGVAHNPAAAPAVAAPPVPALNGSPGASPTGGKPQSENRPKKFESVDDAVDDWISQNP